MTEEINEYKELSSSIHTDKINKLIDDLTTDLQRNTKQILYDQLIRVKHETSRMLSKSTKEVQSQDSTVQTCLSNESLVSSPSTSSSQSDRDTTLPKKRCRQSSV